MTTQEQAWQRAKARAESIRRVQTMSGWQREVARRRVTASRVKRNAEWMAREIGRNPHPRGDGRQVDLSEALDAVGTRKAWKTASVLRSRRRQESYAAHLAAEREKRNSLERLFTQLAGIELPSTVGEFVEVPAVTRNVGRVDPYVDVAKCPEHPGEHATRTGGCHYGDPTTPYPTRQLGTVTLTQFSEVDTVVELVSDLGDGRTDVVRFDGRTLNEVAELLGATIPSPKPKQRLDGWGRPAHTDKDRAGYGSATDLGVWRTHQEGRATT